MKKGISIFLTIIIVCFMGINSIQVSAKEIRNDSKEECEMRVNNKDGMNGLGKFCSMWVAK